MIFNPTSSDRLLNLYLALCQYPILSDRIRSQMRNELYARGLIKQRDFEEEVLQKATQSQKQEGMVNPFIDESSEIWELRLQRIRDQLTDLMFSEHLSFDIFMGIVRKILAERGAKPEELKYTVNLELAPQDIVFEQALTFEKMLPEERPKVEPRLKEAKVVLIRALISDQLRYINIAKEWFTIHDLSRIRTRKIGTGRIGGKAAGMLLAARILKEVAEPPLSTMLITPESYYVGSDELYSFMEINGLAHWNEQKYKTETEMRQDFPNIMKDFECGVLPPETIEKLQLLLIRVGNTPLIVRSSSLLEDNFGTSFAGKYESIFLPNQGDLKHNISALIRAIRQIYASTLNPSALLYRRSKGLQDYDERMALLIQTVQGERFGRFFLPHAAGVAFSRNFYRWAPQIRREDGFVRLVWGMGTRAVDRVGNDYPRLIALSHPLLRPSSNPNDIRRYSQQYVDLIDLETNQFRSMPIHEVLEGKYPPLRYIAQYEEEGYFRSLQSTLIGADKTKLVLTFDELLKRTQFAERMREMLHILEATYKLPIDMEFTLHIQDAETTQPKLLVTLLQCRPQSQISATEQAPLPINLPNEDILFSTRFMVPQGYISRASYILFVHPAAYFSLPSSSLRYELARAISRVNLAMEDESFICVGPGRWGSANSDLGVPIEYGDIYNCRALVELTGKGIGTDPEPSLGTHFFQDLLEGQIYPLALKMDDPKTLFNREIFYELPNHLLRYSPADEKFLDCLRIIRIADYRPGCHAEIVMDDEKGQAIAYIKSDPKV